MNLLEISLSSILLIIIVFIIRLFAIYRISKKVFVFLWSLILLRLLTPFSIPENINIFKMFAKENEKVIPNIVTILRKGEDEFINKISISKEIVIFIYLLVILIIGFYFLMMYYRSYRMFSKSSKLNHVDLSEWKKTHKLRRIIKVRQSHQITSPLTYGIIKPVILLPNDFNWEDIKQVEYILEHEFIHIKKFDVFKKGLLTFTLILHWFNPFVWILYILANRDIELACDEEVIETFGKNKKSVYASILLTVEEEQSNKLMLSSSFRRNSIEERIVIIMKAKKNSISAAVFSSIVLLGVLVYISSPIAKEISSNISFDQKLVTPVYNTNEEKQKNCILDANSTITVSTASQEGAMGDSVLELYQDEMLLVREEMAGDPFTLQDGNRRKETINPDNLEAVDKMEITTKENGKDLKVEVCY